MLLALHVAPYMAILAVSHVPGFTKVSLHIIHYKAQFLTGKQTIEEQIMVWPSSIIMQVLNTLHNWIRFH